MAGVNFRWYLANSVLREAVEEGQRSEDRTVFLSLHADSLHPAVRGHDGLHPGGEVPARAASARTGSPTRPGGRSARQPRVSFSRRERIEAEGVSRDLAERIVASFRAAVCPSTPSSRSAATSSAAAGSGCPAILRYNRIPARVLIEVCNLNNPEDRQLLAPPQLSRKALPRRSSARWSTSTAVPDRRR